MCDLDVMIDPSKIKSNTWRSNLSESQDNFFLFSVYYESFWFELWRETVYYESRKSRIKEGRTKDKSF
jgi:hypothetical protein